MPELHNIRERITASIITRDAAGSIATAINSVKPVCGRIVVVDTGSNDNTPQICSRLGAEVFFYKWNNDFSEARNHALQYINSEWVLVIDSDEVLDYDSFVKNIHLIENEKTGGISILLENYLNSSGESVSSEHKYTRLFRKHPDIEFSGRVHEQIRESIISAGFEIVDSGILIRHYGYSEISETKISRNKELLNAELKDKPEDDWLKYHLAETEFAAGNIEEAAKLFNQIQGSTDLAPEQSELVKIRLAQILLAKDEYEAIPQQLDFISKDINREGLRKYVFATSLLMQKKFSKALSLFKSPEINLSKLVDNDKLAEMIKKLPVLNM